MEHTAATFLEMQVALLERIAAFEEDREARWLLVSTERKTGITTALVEYVAQSTRRDVLWVTSEQLPDFPRRIAAQSGASERRMFVVPEQVELLELDGPSRFIQCINPGNFTARRIATDIFHGSHRPHSTLLDQIVFFTASGGRPLLLLTEHMDISMVPTHPQFNGHRLLAECFADKRIKTVIIYNGPLPPPSSDCPETLEWRHVVEPRPHSTTTPPPPPPPIEQCPITM
jgi:hypothetical protein